MSYTNNVLSAYHKAKYVLAEASDGDSPMGKILRTKFPIEFFEELRKFVKELEDAGIQLIDTKTN